MVGFSAPRSAYREDGNGPRGMEKVDALVLSSGFALSGQNVTSSVSGSLIITRGANNPCTRICRGTEPVVVDVREK